jgi:hypothetical protein
MDWRIFRAAVEPLECSTPIELESTSPFRVENQCKWAVSFAHSTNSTSVKESPDLLSLAESM